MFCLKTGPVGTVASVAASLSKEAAGSAGAPLGAPTRPEIDEPLPAPLLPVRMLALFGPPLTPMALAPPTLAPPSVLTEPSRLAALDSPPLPPLGGEITAAVVATFGSRSTNVPSMSTLT